jgi:NCS1 family nucleobase:cation symporter-1
VSWRAGVRAEDTSIQIVAAGVPANQQTMSLEKVFWSHFSPNIAVSGWIIGILLIAAGLDFWSALGAVLLGNVLGGVPPAFAAVMGPRNGRTQMETSRSSFGRLGIRVPAALNWINGVGWNAVNNVIASVALLTLVGLSGLQLPFWVALTLLAVTQGYSSMHGHHLVQVLQKYLGYVLLLSFVVTGIVAVLSGGSIVTSGHGMNAGAFTLGVALVASYTLGWAPYASDYTRYLPRDTPARSIFALGFLGLFASSFITEFLGLLTASHFPNATPIVVIHGIVAMTGAFGPVVLVAVVVSSIAANSLATTTASYSVISAGIRVPRNVAAALTTAIGFGLSLWGARQFSSLYEDYLFLMGYWVAPWLGIVLASWWLGQSDDLEGGSAWRRGATIFLIVTVATILLFSSSGIYTGPVTRWLGGADVGYFVGFFAAAIAFAITTPSRETAICQPT